MPTLTIGRALVLRLARLDAAETQNQTDADNAIADTQAAHEAQISDSKLAEAGANAALSATLTLGVAKQIAAELLARIAREPGTGRTIMASGITVAQIPDHAQNLRDEAETLLAPHKKRPAPLNDWPATPPLRPW